MNITSAQLKAQVEHLKQHGQIHVIRDAIPAHAHPSLTVQVLVAVGSRETNCTNIVGDGGHGRGMFQIDDRSWHEWLMAHLGCPSGSFKPVEGHHAGDHGYCPSVTAGVIKACEILDAGIASAKANNVPDGRRLKFACSAYNAGLGGAASGFHNHGDSDHFTTGSDYGADVLARADVLFKMLGG